MSPIFKSLLLFCFLSYVFSSQIGSLKKETTQDQQKTQMIKKSFWPEGKIIYLNEAEEWINSTLDLKEFNQITNYQENDDELGFKHIRYFQSYKGIKVEDSRIYLHLKDNEVHSMNVEMYKGISLANTSSSISPDLAIEKATLHLSTDLNSIDKNESESPLLVIYLHNENYHLAYKVDYYKKDHSIRRYVYVDAHTGNVITTRNRIHETFVKGTAHTFHHGTQTITVDSLNPSLFKLNGSFKGMLFNTFNLNGSSNYSTATDIIDSNNVWDDTTNNLHASYDVHYGVEGSLDYFRNVHNRSSFDNLGGTANAYFNFANNWSNASWDGQRMRFGKGNGTSTNPFTSLKIVAHEYTHALTQHSADLVYQNQSGALNESFSDIFGIAIDHYLDSNSTNYDMFEGIFINSSSGRSVSDPKSKNDPDTYLGQHWYIGTADNGGVHSNSGVQNYWFYLLSEGGTGINDNGDAYKVEAIGRSAAEKIAFRNLVVYLTPNSAMLDARSNSIQSAIDLYGACSPEVIQTKNAWYAVGLGIGDTSNLQTRFTSSITSSCNGLLDVQFNIDSNRVSTAKWYFGDGDSSSAFNPLHSYSGAGNYDVTLIVTGNSNCFSKTTDTLIANDAVRIVLGGPKSNACQPYKSVSSPSLWGIKRFKMDSINRYSSLSFAGYEDFSCTDQTTLIEGERIPIEVHTGSSFPPIYYHIASIWIDFDNDGILNDSNEVVHYSNAQFRNTGYVQIPSGAVLDSILRLRVAVSNLSISNSCDPNIIQAEDYKIIIKANNNPPNTDFVKDKTFILKSDSIQFTDRSEFLPHSWHWEFENGSPATSTDQHPKVAYNTLGSHAVRLITQNAYGSDTLERQFYVSVFNRPNTMCNEDSSNAVSGIFYDSGGESNNYQANETCQFSIYPRCASKLYLSFELLDVRYRDDRLYVYDGDGTHGSPLLYDSWSPNVAPDTMVANSGRATLKFNSNSINQNQGWKIIWFSDVNNAPIQVNTAFSVSDTNPPLNTEVQFIDLTSGYPSLWQWDFGDGSGSTDANPKHTYQQPGTYNVKLKSFDCVYSGEDSLLLIVQDAPQIRLADSLIMDTLCEGSIMSYPIYVINDGLGEAVLEATKGSTKAGSNTFFFNGFDDGTYQDWQRLGSTIAVLNSNGNRFLSIYGTGTNGVRRDFQADSVDYFSIDLNRGHTGGGGYVSSNFCEIKSPNDQRLFTIQRRNIPFIGHSFEIIGDTTVYQLVNSTWTQVEIKNIDYSSRTFDVFINQQVVHIGMGFQDTAANLMGRVDLYSKDHRGRSYYDNIQIGRELDSSYFNMNPMQWTTLPGDTTIVNFDIDLSNVEPGNYSTKVHIESNHLTDSLDSLEFQILVRPTYLNQQDFNLCFGDSLFFAGQYYKQDGLYSDTSLSRFGCDSINQINLRIDSIAYVLSKDTICEGDSLFFFGEYHNIEGWYYDSLLSANGCDSIIFQKELKIDSIEYNSSSASICSGDSLFIFQQYQHQAGTYFDTLSNAKGCDSILVFSLSIDSVYSTQSNMSICIGDSALIFGNYRKVGGIYTDSSQSLQACDSISTVQLIVLPIYQSQMPDVSICMGDSVIIYGQYRHQSGMYTDSLLSKEGCDSIESTQLIVNQVHVTQLPIQAICQGDSLLIHGQYQHQAGWYVDSLQTTQGCDSILSVQLTVDSSYYQSSSLSICEGDSALIFGAYRKQAGNYYDSLSSIRGCDSVLMQSLSIDTNYFRMKTISLCYGDSIFIAGNYVHTTGLYADSLQSAAGCDSILTTQLNVERLNDSVRVDTTVLEALATNVSYQWIDCNANYAILAGEIGKSFTATQNGSYAVEITSNTCKDTSACYPVMTIGLGEPGHSETANVQVFPNPNTGRFTVLINRRKAAHMSTLRIFNYQGQLVLEKANLEKSNPIDVAHLAEGIYYLVIGEEVLKVVLMD